MKSIKLFLSAIVLVATFSFNTFAQESANVAVDAVVVTALTVANEADIDLGTIQNGIASYIKANANDGTANANLGETAAAGQISIIGNATSSVDIAFGTATLSDGTNTITFTPTVYFGATEVSTGDDITLTAGPDNLDVGGSLAAPSVAGTYSTGSAGGSPITITVTYN